MKKRLFLILASLITIMSLSYAAPAKAIPFATDEEIPEEERAILVLKKTVSVIRIDNYYFQFNIKDPETQKPYNKKLNDYNKERVTFVRAGEHEIEIRYQSDKGYANPSTFKANLEAGKTYDVVTSLEDSIFGKQVKYDIQDATTHESIFAKEQKLRLAIQYVNTILEPVSNGQDIILSAVDPDKKTDSKTTEKNSDFFITYGPDLTVTYTENENVYKGYTGFEATEAIIYIKFDEDGSLTKDSFLQLNPEDCDRVFEIKEVISLGILKTIKVKSVKPSKESLISFGYVEKK